jgi:hypothetical protein
MKNIIRNYNSFSLVIRYNNASLLSKTYRFLTMVFKNLYVKIIKTNE